MGRADRREISRVYRPISAYSSPSLPIAAAGPGLGDGAARAGMPPQDMLSVDDHYQ